MIAGPRSVYFEQATISSAVKTLVDAGFSAAEVSVADRVWISVETGAIRLIWDDAATAPTTSKGMYIPNHALFLLEGRTNASKAKMIRDGSTDAVVDITIESE